MVVVLPCVMMMMDRVVSGVKEIEENLGIEQNGDCGVGDFAHLA